MWIFQYVANVLPISKQGYGATRFPSRLRSAVDIPADNVHVPDGEEGFEGVGFGVVSVQPQLSQEFKGVQQCGAVGVGGDGAQPPADGLRRRMQTGTDGRTSEGAERGNFASIGLGRKIGFRIQYSSHFCRMNIGLRCCSRCCPTPGCSKFHR